MNPNPNPNPDHNNNPVQVEGETFAREAKHVAMAFELLAHEIGRAPINLAGRLFVQQLLEKGMFRGRVRVRVRVRIRVRVRVRVRVGVRVTVTVRVRVCSCSSYWRKVCHVMLWCPFYRPSTV
jgi:hypothetical protein